MFAAFDDKVNSSRRYGSRTSCLDGEAYQRVNGRPIDRGNDGNVNACDYICFVFFGGLNTEHAEINGLSLGAGALHALAGGSVVAWFSIRKKVQLFCSFAWRFVLLQMAAMKLLGFLMPRVVTHNLYSDTPGGWVMPMKFYVTIITGWDREVFKTQASTTPAESQGFMRSYPPKASCSLRCNWCWPYLEHAPTMQMKLCIQNWTKILRWSLVFFLMLTLPASQTVMLAKV